MGVWLSFCELDAAFTYVPVDGAFTDEREEEGRQGECGFFILSSILPLIHSATRAADYAGAASNSDVQCGQRVAWIGTSEMQYGHVFTVGGAGGPASGSRSLLM